MHPLHDRVLALDEHFIGLAEEQAVVNNARHVVQFAGEGFEVALGETDIKDDAATFRDEHLPVHVAADNAREAHGPQAAADTGDAERDDGDGQERLGAQVLDELVFLGEIHAAGGDLSDQALARDGAVVAFEHAELVVHLVGAVEEIVHEFDVGEGDGGQAQFLGERSVEEARAHAVDVELFFLVAVGQGPDGAGGGSPGAHTDDHARLPTSATAARARASTPGALLGRVTASRAIAGADVDGLGLVCRCSVKADPLCKLDLCTEVSRARLTTHVGLPGIRTGFPPAAGFFFAAKGSTDLGTLVPMLTLAIPQSLPEGDRNASEARTLSVKIAEERP